ncbi:hypothetical protein OESDEN_24226 [Oesophagostomum dentatum]|uniref:Uncharacterized protein n=1 Tax=Oesophagostomum dentatum TaxID=61180 RepID=A0A0B1RYY1_OESDE|nr:hypothetical protein OESDEN_24226 [Oesophagostomum dentatum]
MKNGSSSPICIGNAQWIGIGEQAQDVLKQDLHPKKVMVSIGWNIRGVVYWQLLGDGPTITANLYVRSSEL